MSDAPAAVAAPVTPVVTPPVTPSPPPNVMGQLKPEDPVLLTDKTGKVVSRTMGELANAWRNQPEAADLEDVQLLRQAIKENNVEAAQKLVNKYSPSSSTPAVVAPPTPANAELQALQAEMKTMRESLAKMSPTTASVQEALETHQLTLAIDSVKDKVPLLSRHPERAMLLKNRLGYYDGQAKAHGLTLDTLPLEVRKQVHERALLDVEASIRSTLDIYGAKPTQGQPSRNPVSVNDQNRPDERMVKEPRYKMVTGADGRVTLVDATQPTTASAASAALPSAPVTPLPSGGMVGPVDNSRSEGRVTPGQLLERMRQRSEVLSQTI